MQCEKEVSLIMYVLPLECYYIKAFKEQNDLIEDCCVVAFTFVILKFHNRGDH